MQQNNFNYVPKNQFSSYFNSPYYDVCKKLAILYIVRDHYKGESNTKYNEMPSMNSSMMMPK